MADFASMPDDPDFLDGVRRLCDGQWFEAHESLESAWRRARSEHDRNFLQGLIHVAVALVHRERGNPAGAHSQWRKAGERWADLPVSCHGVGIGSWRAELAPWFRAGAPRTDPGGPTLTATLAARIDR